MKIFKVDLEILKQRVKEIEDFLYVVEIQKKFVTELNAAENNMSIKNSYYINEYKEKISLLQNSTIQYNAVIISIYGCFENFIDNIFKTYIECVYKITNLYQDLSPRTQDKYIKKVAEYLSNPTRFSGYELTTESVINIPDMDTNRFALEALLPHSHCNAF